MVYIFAYCVLSELEKKILELTKSKEEKAAEVSLLLGEVESLRGDLSKRAEEYVSCTS